MSLESWEKDVLAKAGAARRVSKIESELRKPRWPRYRCHACGREEPNRTAIERHVDRVHGGGRIECVMPGPASDS